MTFTDKELNLLRHRAKKPENREWKAVEMSNEDLLERRILFRKILRGTRFADCSNSDVDNMTLQILETHLLVQDTECREYALVMDGTNPVLAEERKNRSNIPEEYKNILFSGFNWSLYKTEVSKQKKTAISFITKFFEFREKSLGLYICSSTKGSGKTMLSASILNEISKRHGINTKFITVYEYLDTTRRKYEGSIEAIEKIKNAGLLVVDDIGTQMKREWTDNTFYELVNYRYSHKLPTIYTSNIPVEKLQMDERIIDRIERQTISLFLPEETIRRDVGNQVKEDFVKKLGL